MIQGCIVAKLVLGYLREEGFYKTCSAFQDECPLFVNDNKELDNVFLTADLKTILDDYSQLKESGREGGNPSSTAVLASLWKNLDIVIGQLKYATIPSNTSKTSRETQSSRTRRLNYGRTRSNTLQKKQESIPSTSSSPSTTQPQVKPSGSNTTEKLPLPRLPPPVDSSQNVPLKSKSKNKTTDLQSTRRITRRTTKNSALSTSHTEPVNMHREPNTVQSVGSSVAISSPVVREKSQVSATSIDVTETVGTVANSTSDEPSRNSDFVEEMFDSVDDGSVFNNGDFEQTRTENKSPTVVVVADETSHKEGALTEEQPLTHSSHSQDELQLRSPKRKGIQPKKRVPQGPSGTSAVNESPVKPVPPSVEVEMDLMCSSDSLTPQSFLGTLLNTPLLQEKLAENINKVVGSTRQQSACDEATSDNMQSLTTTEASSDDVLPGLNQGAGDDIPVKEIMDLMQADPAFDVLFSFFGLDALDALPSAADSAADSDTCALLPEASTGSSQLSPSGGNLSDALGASSLLEDCQSDSGKEITSTLSASDQQVETPCSSSATDLHLSATSIVTDALLLLAGSPQKTLPQVQSRLDHSANVLSSGKKNSVTPPKKTPSVQERLDANDSRPCVDSLPNRESPNQARLVTSTFPYVRALDFSLDKEPEAPVKRGRKRDVKAKKGAKQTMTDKQNKGQLNKKGARSNNKHSEATKSSSSSSSSSNAASAYRTVQAASPSNVAKNVYAGNIQPISNCSSTTPISSTVSSVVKNSCSMGLPNNVPSPTFRLSPLPGNLAKSSSGFLPLTVSNINSVPAPTSSLVTLANSMSGPVNFTNAVTSHSSLLANYTNMGTSPVLVNCNNSSTVNVRSPFIPASVGSVCTASGVSHPFQHTLAVPSTASFMNPVTCPVTASTVNLVNSHPAWPLSFGISGASSFHQVFNSPASPSFTGLSQAVIPGNFTDSSAVTSTTIINNSLSSPEQNACESSGLETSATNASITQAAAGPSSMQASNLLHSLALQLGNTDKNKTQNTTPSLNATQLRKERAAGLQGSVDHSTSESEHRNQALKENSTLEKNSNSEENATILSEKRKGNASVVCKSSYHNQLEKSSRDTETAAHLNSVNSVENKSDSSTGMAVSKGCGEVMKENSTNHLQSGTINEAEGVVSSKLQGKRRRDSQQKEKEKKTKSSSRPSKRSKTKAQSINFPSDLNVEEFLSKLHYEAK